MKLYMFMVAPNPTKVRLYVAEKAAAGCKIELEEVVVNLLEGEHREPAHRARNPFGLLPVLELDDGSHVAESLAIIEYLEERFPTPSMYGPDPEARVVARQYERIADTGVLMSIGRMVHATRSPVGHPANPEVAAYFRTQLTVRLKFFEKLLSDGRPFIVGDELTVADCTMAAGFQFARVRDFDLLGDYPAIAHWDAEFRKRPSAQAILVG